MKDGSDGSRAGASVSGQVARLTPPWREEIEVKVLKLGDLGVRWAVRAKHTPYAVRRKLAGGIPSHWPRAALPPATPKGAQNLHSINAGSNAPMFGLQISDGQIISCSTCIQTLTGSAWHQMCERNRGDGFIRPWWSTADRALRLSVDRRRSHSNRPCPRNRCGRTA